MSNRFLLLIFLLASALSINAQNFGSAVKPASPETELSKSGKVDLNKEFADVATIPGVKTGKVTYVMETFDTEIPSDWTVNNTGTGDLPGWFWAGTYSANPIPLTGFACIDSDENGSGNTTAGELLSPTFDCSSATSVFLEFDARYDDITAGGGDLFTVDVFDGTDWQNVLTWDEDHGDDDAPEHVSIDISAYVNAACQVRFSYADGGWDWYAGVDNVTVIEPEEHDLAVVGISPNLVVGGSTVNPEITLRNMGGNEETGFDVTFTDEVSYTETITVSDAIAPLTEMVVSMPDWTPANGTYTVTATVSLTDDGDASNDSYSRQVVVDDIYYMGNGDVTTCSGVFYDSGGPDGDFENDEDYIMTFYPGTAGNMIEVEFTEFDCAGSGYDYLEVYNGANTSAPLLVSSQEVGDEAMIDLFRAENPDGALTFHFISSSVAPNPGWTANVSCHQPPAHDLGVTGIAPGFVLSGTTVQPEVTIKNFGQNEEAAYSVHLTDGVAYDQTYSVTTSVAQFESATIQMPDWTPADGTYSLTATVTVADDTNDENDMLTIETIVSNISLYATAGNTTTGAYNEISLVDGSLQAVGTIGTEPFPMSEEYGKPNKLYRVYSDLSLVSVDPANGETTDIGTISGMTGTPTALAYDWDNDIMYIVVLDGSNAPQLGTLDLNTLEATVIGTGTGMVIGADMASDGYLYGPTIDEDNLVKIDPADGSTTIVGSVGLDLNYGQDVTYDNESQMLYTITCGEAYKFGTYNLATGAFEEIADMGADQYGTITTYDMPQTYTVTFAITDGANPIEGAELSFYGEMFTSDADGEITMMIPEGTYDFTVNNGFCDTFEGTFAVAAAEMTVDVAMTCPDLYVATVAVSENWGSNEPIEGAEVIVTYISEEYTQVTDASGEAMFEFPTDVGYAYAVNAPGYLEASGTFDIADADTDVPVMLDEDMVPPSGLNVSNIDENAGTADLTWGAMEAIELYQHDGAIPASPNAYYQSYNYGYGVVYDLSQYPDATVDAIDFHHMLWGLPAATFEYNVHIIDWTDYSTIQVVGPLSTTTNDDWELNVDLGQISANGTSQLGIFIEPLSNAADDAYPDITADNTPAESCDGNSIVIGDLSDVAGSNSGSTVGDFFIDLWITTSNVGKAVKAEKISLNGVAVGETKAEVETNNNVVASNEFVQNQTVAKAVQSYNVFLDGDEVEADITDSAYTYTGLVPGTYTAGVSANYESGESDISTIEFVVPEPLYMVTFNVQHGGDPMADVQISMGDHSMVTDATGTAGAEMPDGEHNYTLTHPDYFNEITGSVTVAGEPVTVDVEFVGINDFNTTQEFTIYPNPTEGIFYIKAEEDGIITITNAIGKVVMEKQIDEDAQINMSSHDAGIYFIRLQSGSDVITKRIIIE